MRVAFRTDSSVNIGSGHLMRCLTLANELRNRGAEILFISREHPGNLISRLDAATYSVCRLPVASKQLVSVSDDYAAWLGVTMAQDAEETLAAFNGQTYDWLVVDHYGLDICWEQRVRPAVSKILVIDDLANRQHDCDVLLDQNYFGAVTDERYKHLIPEYCRSLLGPRFALLQPDYATLHNLLPARDGQIRRVLVFFGASDTSDQTSKVLTALSHPDLAHLLVDVVLGANHPNPENITTIVNARLGTTLHQNIPSLACLMVRADLFLGAGGATTWERMCCGLPSIVVSVAKNQQAVADALCIDGYQMSLARGRNTSSVEWSSEISKLITKPVAAMKLVKRARKLVDGLGGKRIVHAILGVENDG